MPRSAVKTRVITILTTIIYIVFKMIITTHVLTHIGCQIKEVVSSWAFPCLDIENHCALSL